MYSSPSCSRKKSSRESRSVGTDRNDRTRNPWPACVYGLAISLVAMFGLLTFEFRSYFQPLLILAIIPFGAIGAILGHMIMGIDVTIFSLFGMVALSGVVINDSIVLIDFINHRVRDGIPVQEALLDAGRQRFRPVLLTTLTTVAGLLPLLTETSMQAQVLIPMATSLCFGLMFSTVLILLLVPTFYMIHARITATSDGGSGDGSGFDETLVDPRSRDWNDDDSQESGSRGDGLANGVVEDNEKYGDEDDTAEDDGGSPDEEKKKVLAAGAVSREVGQGQNLGDEKQSSTGSQSPPR